MSKLKSVRAASIGLTKDTFEVAVQRDMTAKEVGVLFTSIVDKIEELTGHPCFSGTHDVIVRGRYDEIAQVQFRG
jgi:hypothetical protein